MEIRADQIATFDAAAERRFVDRAYTFLRATLPDVTKAIDDQELRDYVREGVSGARRFGFKSEASIVRYLLIICALQLYCKENWQPPLERILRLETMGAEYRIECMGVIAQQFLTRAGSAVDILKM